MMQMQQAYSTFNDYRYFISSKLYNLMKEQLTLHENLNTIESNDTTHNKNEVLII